MQIGSGNSDAEAADDTSVIKLTKTATGNIDTEIFRMAHPPNNELNVALKRRLVQCLFGLF
jgi:hypothetical protein